MDKNINKKRGWKGKVIEGVDKLSGGISKMPDYQRVRLELIIYSYLVLAFGVLIFINALVSKTTSTILFSITACLMILQFINKSTQYSKLKFLNKLQENQNGTF